MEHRHVGWSRSELILAGSDPLFLSAPALSFLMYKASDFLLLLSYFRFGFAPVLSSWLFFQNEEFLKLIRFCHPSENTLDDVTLKSSSPALSLLESMCSESSSPKGRCFLVVLEWEFDSASSFWKGSWASLGCFLKGSLLGTEGVTRSAGSKPKALVAFLRAFAAFVAWLRDKNGKGLALGSLLSFPKGGMAAYKQNKTMVFLGSAHLSQVGGGVIHKHIARYWGNFCKHAAACQSLSNSIHSTNFVPMVPFYLGSRQRIMTSSIKPAQGKLMPFPAILRMLACVKSEKSTGSWKSTSQENAVISRKNPKLEWCEVESC